LNKKRFLLLFTLILTFTGCNASVDPANHAKFQSAQDQFEQAEQPQQFLQAAAMYQEILDSGIDSGAVLYNQGNAFIRAGERGRAIACYRQAKRYRPRDPYLDANLRYALGENQSKRPKPIVEYVLFWSSWISYYGKFQASVACALVTFCLSVGSMHIKPLVMRRAAALSLCITIAVVISAAYDWHRFSHTKHGVVITKEAIARKGYSETYVAAFTQPLAEGTEFQVLGQRNGWTQIRLEPARDAWLPNKDVVVY
jgi:hypothetical protein